MTYSKFIARAGAGFALLLIAACAPEIEGRLYMRDIQDVIAHNEVLIVPAELRIPEMGEDKCDEGLANLTLKLGDITPISDTGKCIEIDNSWFSQFTLDLPIATNSDALEGAYLAEIIAARADTSPNAAIALTFTLNRALEDVQQAIGRGPDSGFNASADEDEYPRFIFTFENDASDPITIMPNYVFIDGEPGLPGIGEPISLARRESVMITFSDVVSAHIANAGSFTFAKVLVAASDQ